MRSTPTPCLLRFAPGRLRVTAVVSAIMAGLVYLGRPAEVLGMGTMTLACIHQNCALYMFWSFAHPAIY